jgi:hypothetical protein
MYAVGKVSEGIILICQNCGHIEHVSQFNLNLGSQRTQAERAMDAHSRDKHNTAILGPLAKNFWLDAVAMKR